MNSGIYYDYEHGRWMCPTIADARQVAKHHEGERVYTYSRDKQGHIITVKPYWTPEMKDDNMILGIDNGKIKWKDDS